MRFLPVNRFYEIDLELSEPERWQEVISKEMRDTRLLIREARKTLGFLPSISGAHLQLSTASWEVCIEAR
jgi:hypothetical protein